MMALEMILDFNTPAASMRDMAAIDPRLVSFEADPAAQGGTEASRSNIFTPFSIRGSRVTVEAFAYNKQVPGPTLRVTQGDRVRINVTNRLPEDTTVHWHGLPGDGDDQHEGGQLLKIRFVGSNTTAIHPMHIHGGPFTQYGNKYFDEFQVYARAGYAVVYSNPRGSSGYSEEWGRAICGPGELGPGWGTVDYEDVIAALDTALERFDFPDEERTGVNGRSIGGLKPPGDVGHTERGKSTAPGPGLTWAQQRAWRGPCRAEQPPLRPAAGGAAAARDFRRPGAEGEAPSKKC